MNALFVPEIGQSELVVTRTEEEELPILGIVLLFSEGTSSEDYQNQNQTQQNDEPKCVPGQQIAVWTNGKLECCC